MLWRDGGAGCGQMGKVEEMEDRDEEIGEYDSWNEYENKQGEYQSLWH